MTRLPVYCVAWSCLSNPSPPIPPLLFFTTTLLFTNTVFQGWTKLGEHHVPLLPRTNTLLVNLIVCDKSILSFTFKGKEREKPLMLLFFVSCILNYNTKSLSFVMKCIKTLLSIQRILRIKDSCKTIWSFPRSMCPVIFLHQYRWGHPSHFSCCFYSNSVFPVFLWHSAQVHA